jgi:hypothetical protein
MPEMTLGPDEYVSLEYKIAKPRLVEFELASDIPVRTYIVGPKALQRFEEGSMTFKYWGGFPDPRKLQRQKVYVPFSGKWYLIVSNPSTEDEAEIEYEVRY